MENVQNVKRVLSEQKNKHFDTKMNKKIILDVCCGGKAFWFNKNHLLFTKLLREYCVLF